MIHKILRNFTICTVTRLTLLLFNYQLLRFTTVFLYPNCNKVINYLEKKKIHWASHINYMYLNWFNWSFNLKTKNIFIMFIIRLIKITFLENFTICTRLTLLLFNCNKVINYLKKKKIHLASQINYMYLNWFNWCLWSD